MRQGRFIDKLIKGGRLQCNKYHKRIFTECSGSSQPEDVKRISPENGAYQLALEDEQRFSIGKEEKSGGARQQSKDLKRICYSGEKLKSEYGWNLENLLDIDIK